MEEWLMKELTRAYMVARKGKRKTKDEHKFELNEMENLVRLRDDIIERRYKPSRGVAFIVRRPVIREIFAAPFRDRVVHHFLYNMVGEWWDRHFIYDSYSCRVGKGTLFGIQRLAKQMRAISDNYQKKTYIIKLDLRGYFMSLPRKGLMERIVWGLDRQFPERGRVYDICKYLWGEIIFDDPVKGVMKKGNLRDWDDLPKSKSLFCQQEGKGVVIGNLSSQLLSNIYLDQLDRYIKYELGYKYYGRYVDDFYYLVLEKDLAQAKRDIGAIEMYLKEIGMVLHPKKRYIQPIERGVPFLGAIVYPYRILPGKRLKKFFYEGVGQVMRGEKDIQTIESYLGHLKYMNSYNLEKTVFRKMEEGLIEKGKL